VNVPALVEMLNVSPVATRAASLGQVSDGSPQTFNESLLAASKASSGASAANQAGAGTGYRQKPASQDEKLPRSMPHVRTVQSPAPQKTLQRQVMVAQQLPLINPEPIQMQLPIAMPGRSAGQPMRDVPAETFLPMESKLDQPVVAKSDTVPSSHTQTANDSPHAASVLAQVPNMLQTATDLANALGNGVLGTVSSTLSTPPSANASADSSPITSPAPSPVSSAIQKPLPDAIPSTVPIALPSAVLNLSSPILPNAIPDASSKAVPMPVLHDAVNPSARGAVAPKSSSVTTSQPDPAVTPDPGGLAIGLSVPGTPADQLVALIQPGGGLLADAQSSASSVSPATIAKPSDVAVTSGKAGADNAINDATGIKQHAQATSELGTSQTGTQGTAQSGDQSQDDASQQGQSAAPAQVNFANHTVAAVDHVQNAGVAAPLQTAPTPAGVTGHTTRTADVAAPATIALPQSVPVINTAKLIQSMGQSEMRVGMRSNDFGNISISTSATRDLISAQISLDHGELARTLAAHLPEMQARLGGNQAMDVRIDINGQATGQGARTSPGMSNGSPDGSSGDRHQRGSTASNQPADGFAGRGSSIAVAGLPSGEGGLDARLDIRV
jgi:hypothetical protein